MARKELGLDSMGIQKTMRMGDYLADAGGQFALNAISGLVGALTYFYTDKVGIAALTAANVALISKIIDAFTDLIMGKIMDNGKIASGLGAAMIGWILAAVGYDSAAAAATTAVRYGIYSFTIYLPLVLLVVMFLLTTRFDLESKYADIMKEVHERKAVKTEE